MYPLNVLLTTLKAKMDWCRVSICGATLWPYHEEDMFACEENLSLTASRSSLYPSSAWSYLLLICATCCHIRARFSVLFWLMKDRYYICVYIFWKTRGRTAVTGMKLTGMCLRICLFAWAGLCGSQGRLVKVMIGVESLYVWLNLEYSEAEWREKSEVTVESRRRWWNLGVEDQRGELIRRASSDYSRIKDSIFETCLYFSLTTLSTSADLGVCKCVLCSREISQDREVYRISKHSFMSFFVKAVRERWSW